MCERRNVFSCNESVSSPRSRETCILLYNYASYEQKKKNSKNDSNPRNKQGITSSFITKTSAGKNVQ